MINIFFILLLLSGCEDENPDVHGCMDPNAINFSINANIDNGNCLYDAETTDNDNNYVPVCHVDVCLSIDGNNLNYESMEDIAGFQFDHDGCLIDPYASGGDAGDSGFSISGSQYTVLGFSMAGEVVPSGIGTLVVLFGNPVQACLSELIFSGLNGLALDVEFID